MWLELLQSLTHTAIAIEKCVLLITSKGLRKSQKEEVVHCFYTVLSACRDIVLQQPEFVFSLLTRMSHHTVLSLTDKSQAFPLIGVYLNCINRALPCATFSK